MHVIAFIGTSLLNGNSALSCAWIPLGWTFGQVSFLWQISQGLNRIIYILILPVGALGLKLVCL